MIIKIPNGPILNPDHVVSIVRDYYERMLIITDVSGQKHEVSPSYGQTIYDLESSVTTMLNTKSRGQK